MNVSKDRAKTVEEMKALRDSAKALREAETNRNRAISRAWDAWLDSEEGQGCLGEGAYGEYLRNRLWRAFFAGALWTRLDLGEPSQREGTEK
jgi:hypothetical protein